MAVAWARIAGWMRWVGQVTAVVTSRPVVAAMPPITDQTKGDSPWLSIHGWKWSEIVTVSNPACSALRLLDEGPGAVLLATTGRRRRWSCRSGTRSALRWHRTYSRATAGCRGDEPARLLSSPEPGLSTPGTG